MGRILLENFQVIIPQDDSDANISDRAKHSHQDVETLTKTSSKFSFGRSAAISNPFNVSIRPIKVSLMHKIFEPGKIAYPPDFSLFSFLRYMQIARYLSLLLSIRMLVMWFAWHKS